jgi:hypothetical protein
MKHWWYVFAGFLSHLKHTHGSALLLLAAGQSRTQVAAVGPAEAQPGALHTEAAAAATTTAAAAAVESKSL